MNISLSKVTFSEKLSDETNNFIATVNIDGVPYFTTSNSGTGGPNFEHPLTDDDAGYTKMVQGIKLIEDYAKSLPQEEYYGIMMSSSMEILIGDAFDRWLDDKDKKKFNTKLQSKIIAQENGKCLVYTIQPTIESLVVFAKHHPNAIILNLLALDDAWKIVKSIS